MAAVVGLRFHRPRRPRAAGVDAPHDRRLHADRADRERENLPLRQRRLARHHPRPRGDRRRRRRGNARAAADAVLHGRRLRAVLGADADAALLEAARPSARDPDRAGQAAQRGDRRSARPGNHPGRLQDPHARTLRGRRRRLGPRNLLARPAGSARCRDHARRRPELRGHSRGPRAGAHRVRPARHARSHRRSGGDLRPNAAAAFRGLRDCRRHPRRRHRPAADRRRRHRRPRRAHPGRRTAIRRQRPARSASGRRHRQDDRPGLVGHAHPCHAGRMGTRLPRRRRDDGPGHGQRDRVHHGAARLDRGAPLGRTAAAPRGTGRRRRAGRVRRLLRDQPGRGDPDRPPLPRRRIPADQDLQPGDAARTG
jgi:hypothetical protein